MSRSHCRLRAVVAAVALAALSHHAGADGLPGLRGHDHTGITVPDLPQAVSFFVDTLGCQRVMSFGPVADQNGTFMQQALDVHPRTVINQIVMIRCGTGSNIELFSYSAPDQKTAPPKNSDIGGMHIALYVDDIKVAAEYLRAKGVETLAGPLPMTEGANAGQSILYFKAPWGLYLEAITYPQGMAYEKTSDVKLWNPRDPGR